MYQNHIVSINDDKDANEQETWDQSSNLSSDEDENVQSGNEKFDRRNEEKLQ